MTIVPASTRTTSYTLSSATAGPFNVGFRIFDATLAVYVNEALRTDYTVSATFTGGFSDAATITFSSALASGDIIRIDGDMPVARGAEYLNPDPSLTTKLNIEQGRQWAAMQQLARDVERVDPQELLSAVQAAEDARDAAITAAASINTIAVANTAALKALDTVQYDAALIESGANAGTYIWTAGDFTLQHTEEAGADFFYIKASAVAITAGCWVRQAVKADPADFHYLRAMDGSIALEVRAQGEAVSWLGTQQGNNSGGGTTPYGPTIYTEGIYANADLNVTMKGTGKMFIGGDEGIILQLEPRGDGYVTDRFPVLRPGAVGAGTYAQLLSAGGVEIGANGFPVFQVLGGAGDGTALLTLTPSSNSTLVMSTPAGDSFTIVPSGGLFLKNMTAEAWNYTIYSVVTGGTVNLGPFNGLHAINPNTNPIATLTINFPAAPNDKDVYHIAFANGVNSVTWASLGGHTIRQATALMTRETPVSFIYTTSLGWVRF